MFSRVALMLLYVCAGVTCAVADDKAAANKTFVETVQLLKQAAAAEPSEAIGLYEKALRNLDSIVTNYPSSDLAVQIISGQAVGLVSRTTIEMALDNSFEHIAQSIRAALVSYVADSADHLFPTAASIHNYTTLRTVVNQNGGRLPETEGKARVKFISYETQDTDNDGEPDGYLLILAALDANGKPVAQMRVTQEGVYR